MEQRESLDRKLAGEPELVQREVRRILRVDKSGATSHYFDCACHSPDHTLRFAMFRFEDSVRADFPDLYAHVFLRPDHRWYIRLWHAARHVFGYKSRFGDFGEWSLRYTEAHALKHLLETYIEEYEKAAVASAKDKDFVQ